MGSQDTEILGKAQITVWQVSLVVVCPLDDTLLMSYISVDKNLEPEKFKKILESFLHFSRAIDVISYL